MQTKNMTIEEMDEAGKGLARLAILSEVDHDGDTYKAGAFSWKEGGDQWAPILPAHNRSKMPFGKARVFERDGAAFAELNINLGTQVGKDWHSALKFDLDTGKPVQEWSYGYDALEAEQDYQSGRGAKRVLTKVDVSEVSTVIRGAGIGTGTLSMKAAKDTGELKAAHFERLLGDLGALADALETDPSIASATGIKQLTQIHGELGDALAEIASADPSAMNAAGQKALFDYLSGMAAKHLRA